MRFLTCAWWMPATVVLGARGRRLFMSFPYACPEPVLAKKHKVYIYIYIYMCICIKWTHKSILLFLACHGLRTVVVTGDAVVVEIDVVDRGVVEVVLCPVQQCDHPSSSISSSIYNSTYSSISSSI
jgi:hypothetical protein